MARRLTEEQVTKSLLRWLIRNNWTIIAFDFPQSGTGRCLHPNNTDSKTDGIWIPDIVAHRENNLVFFENKDKFMYSDVEKVIWLKKTKNYLVAIHEITQNYNYDNIYYGIGFPHDQNNINKAEPYLEKVDFLLTAIDRDHANVDYDPYDVFV